MVAVQLLKLIASIRPEAWDAIIPHSPAIGVRAIDRVALNPQPLPPRDALAVAAAAMAHDLVRIAVEVEVRGESATGFVTEFVDDWCGTPWPRKWPWPWPGPRPKDGPQPDPWDVAIGRVIGATVLASAGGRLGETKLAGALLNGAEKLAEAAARGR